MTSADSTTALPSSQLGLRRIFLVFVAVTLLCAAAASLSRGIWLDEFWSRHNANPSASWSELAQRWLNDPHPLLPNLLYRLVLAAAGDSIGWSRILLNAPAMLALCAATLFFHQRSRTSHPFYIVLAILLISLPSFIDSFSNLRSYLWQICWVGIVAQFLFFTLTESFDEGGEPQAQASASQAAPLVLGMIAIFVSINLHFLGGAVISVAIVLLLGHLLRRREWRPFGSIAAAAALAWLAILIQAALQYRNVARNLDFNWIATSTSDALAAFAGAIGMIVIVSPIAAWLAVFGRATHAGDDPAIAASERDFIRLLLLALGLSALLLLALNSLKPVVVDRYLLGWQVLACAIVAAAAARALAASRLLFGSFVLVAALFVLGATIHFARAKAWHAGRDHIAATVRACPSTKVYAMSPWRLGNARQSRLAAFESPVFADAYRQLARQGGFTLSILPDAQTLIPVGGACPTLLWVEHAGPGSTPDVVLRAARIGFPAGTRLNMFKSQSGFVLSAQFRRGHHPVSL
ncbi:hypothetical protein [Sphingomonas sp.]|uniref:hypothetical protein n=1 Tax=Sphingomonas sp. TaxID=28214 RepID=UPI002FC7E7F8